MALDGNLQQPAMHTTTSSAQVAAAATAVLVEFSIRVLARHFPHHSDGTSDDNGDDAVGVYLLGSAEQVGAWDVTRAVPLECISSDVCESEWRAQIAFATESELPLEYKYVLKRRTSHELVSWEALPGDRTLTVSRRTNAALKQPARQSSTHTSQDMPSPGPRSAALGNNGDRNGFQEWRCSRTAREVCAWWEVDLGAAQPLASIQLWKAMTYHEHPQHPHGQPPVTSSNTATGSPPPPLWLIVSDEPLELADAQRSTSVAVTHCMLLDSTHRVESVSLDCVGRYVRLQHDTTVPRALQFAELEVFAATSASASDSNEAVHPLAPLQQHDGFYGVECAFEGDATEFVDSEWLQSSSALSQVRFWVGSFQDAVPAVQWLSPHDDAPSAVSIDLQCLRRVEVDIATSTSGDVGDDGGVVARSDSWKRVPVDTRSSELLDKDSSGLRAEIEASKRAAVDLLQYLNAWSSDASASASYSQQSSWLKQLSWLQDVSPDRIQALQRRVVTQSFASGSTVLAFGERRRAVVWLREGELELLGPRTSLGTTLIARLPCHTVLNELSVAGRWPQQSAEFRTSGNSPAVCEFLDLVALVDVLGADFVASIRARAIRDAPAPAPAASRQPSETPVVHFTDATHVQVFRAKLPSAALTVGAGTGAAVPAHRFEFVVYAYTRGSMQRGARIGSAHLLPSQLSAHGEGSVTLPILAAGATGGGADVVGQLTLTYLVLHPFAHSRNTLATLWRTYWRPRAPLSIGHRGMGRSFHQIAGFRHALIRENTLASFILAGRSGADFVEFDVQLTRDRVPVLYHDFALRVGLEDVHAWTLGARAEPHDIGVHELTLRELQRVHTTPLSRTKGSCVLQQRVRKHWTQVLRVAGAGASAGAGAGPHKSQTSSSNTVTASARVDTAEVDESHLVDFFPRLEDLLKHVPADVGLNIEIKYPDNLWRTALRESPPFAMNAYVDAILACVFEHAGANHRVFFSCFDPNLCVMLRAKQARYPVLFLTYGSIEPQAFDARLTLAFARGFVAIERLSGIVSNSDAFLTNPELVRIIKTAPAPAPSVPVLLTWGDQNTSHECVQRQKQLALDGVISDNIGDLTRLDAKLAQLA